MSTEFIAELVDWISAAEAAKLLNVSKTTLSRWRNNLEDGKPAYGPPFKKNPGAKNSHVQYRRSALLKWQEQQQVTSKAG